MTEFLPILPVLTGLLTIGAMVDWKITRQAKSQKVTPVNIATTLFVSVCVGFTVAYGVMWVMRALGLIPASP